MLFRVLERAAHKFGQALRVRRLPDAVLLGGVFLALGEVERPARILAVDSQVNVIGRFTAADVVDGHARPANIDRAEVRVYRVAHLLLEHDRVGVLVLVAVEDEADIDVEVAVQGYHAGVHGVAALVEVGEGRHVVAEVVPQRLDDDVALFAQGGLLVVFIEADGLVEVLELLLHCRHLLVPVIKEPGHDRREESET